MDSGKIKIENGVVRIGRDVYPLRNISHVASRWIDPQPAKTRAVKNFIVRTLICTFVAGIVGSASTAGGVLVFLGGMAVLIWRLVLALQLRPLYGLVLNTNGVQHDAIWSFEESEIEELVEAITDALGHPDTASTIINLNHVASGDIIQQYGPGSVGKQVHTGSGDNVVSKTGPAEPVPPQTVTVHGGDYVAQDKTSSQFGNVNHDHRRRLDNPPGTRTDDRR